MCQAGQRDLFRQCFQTGIEEFHVHLCAGDGRAGFGEAHLGFHQIAFERVEFVGGGHGASAARGGGEFLGSVVLGECRWLVNAPVSGVLGGVRYRGIQRGCLRWREVEEPDQLWPHAVGYCGVAFCKLMNTIIGVVGRNHREMQPHYGAWP